MAQSPLAHDAGERYAELERAYTEARWPEVLNQGRQLLADLDGDSDPVSADLASRAHLLLGHAHLYGLRDPAMALPHYQAVLAGPEDPDLRRIVEEALPYCQSAAGTEASAAATTTVAQERPPWVTIESPAEPLEDQTQNREGSWMPQAGSAQGRIIEAATPWLDDPIATGVSGSLTAPARGAISLEKAPSLAVEVVEEPELVEVAQADPSLAEELELELSRIRERRTARREQKAAEEALVLALQRDEIAAQEPDERLEDDPELRASLLRVVITP